MGNLFSDPEYELRTYARQTRIRLHHLDRSIETQEARIAAAQESASDASDASLIIILSRGLDKLKSERVRAYAVLNKIELGIDAHNENEVLHDVQVMIRDIQSNRETEEKLVDVSAAELSEMMTHVTDVSLPLPPLIHPPSSSSSSSMQSKSG